MTFVLRSSVSGRERLPGGRLGGKGAPLGPPPTMVSIQTQHIPPANLAHQWPGPAPHETPRAADTHRGR